MDNETGIPGIGIGTYSLGTLETNIAGTVSGQKSLERPNSKLGNKLKL